MPEEVCSNVPATVTKFVDEEQCDTAAARKCAPVTRQECRDVKEQQPKEVFETECDTEYVEECTGAGYN